jgi:cytoskeletal protein RodZ
MIRVGQRLKEARLAKGLTLEEVSQATKIRSSFLASIEKGEYHSLPSSSYAQGFVRNYAEFLGLPQREILALFKREYDEEKYYSVLPEGFVQQEKLPIKRIKIRQAALLIIGILLLLGGFLFYQYRSAFFDPQLVVTEPKEQSQTQQEIVVIGRTDLNATVFVNNLPVTVNQDGSFMKKITAFPGRNTIIIKSINRFGRETTVQRTVYVKSSP